MDYEAIEALMAALIIVAVAVAGIVGAQLWL